MRLTGTATIQKVVFGIATVNKRISATVTLRTLSPVGSVCPEYDLIDGGFPNTVYVPINGFDLIEGGIP